MGELLRQFWFPCLPSHELPEPDCRPVRVRLLGEDLVAFRNSNGEVGVLAENCPHRGASLYFGRNEEEGLRCVYHGWKFDTSGRCVDMPNEPAESNFKDKVKAVAYPCQDVNGAIWVYMGPRETPPALPPFEVTTLPADHVLPPHIMTEECNWVQGLEGDIDSSHIDWVHARLREDSKERGTFNPDKRPRLEIVPTDYGAFYSAQRHWKDTDLKWHRITQYIMPFFTQIAAGDPNSISLRAWVPIDDNYHMLFSMSGRLDRPVTEQERQRSIDPFAEFHGYVKPTSDPRTRYYSVANMHNDYLVDHELQKKDLVFGVPFIGNIQDRAMTEGMGPIYNRWQEHLGTTDAMVIHVRRTLIDAAAALRARGVTPAHVDEPRLARVRSASILLPEGANWVEATEAARNPDAGVPIASVAMIS
jgi:phenylpropionate dioxygenase-like ring-hydroxylating dioxygenase large terminal subunit